MPSLFPRLLALLGLLLALTLPARATHITGAEISYKPVDNNPRRFLITARLYRDAAAPVDFDASLPLFASLNGCGTGTAPIAQLTRASSTFINYLRCTGGPSVQMQVFYADITLPAAGNWTLSLFSENRTNGIVNLPNSANYGLYAEAQINVLPAASSNNSSPVFTSTVLPYICGTQFHRFSFAAYDAEGDSLVYSLTPPRAASSADPCPQAMPVAPAPHFTLNPATGEVATVPFGLNIGNYIMAVRVEEYRRINNQWTKIGSVLRDLMYPVSNSAGNRNPAFSGLRVGSTAQPLDQVIRVSPGQAVVLHLTATDPDAGQTLRFSSEAATTIPGVAFQRVSATEARLAWQVPTNLPPGRYTLPVVVSDSGCPFNGTEVQTLTFQVTSQVLATPARQRRASLAAYPTPFHDRVQFQLPTSGRQAVQITDSRGRLVADLTSQPDGRVTWQPAAGLAPGLYLARPADGTTVIRLLQQ